MNDSLIRLSYFYESTKLLGEIAPYGRVVLSNNTQKHKKKNEGSLHSVSVLFILECCYFSKIPVRLFNLD